MIRCTTVGVEPSKMCYENCVCAPKCEALKAWEKERQMVVNDCINAERSER